MATDALEWIGLLLRWGHVAVAMAWIGASFYLISWENRFNRSHGLRAGVAGNLWTIQGGDFYYIEKLAAAPDQIPQPLQWFKYEAYLTWVSGFLLLCLLYYTQAPLMLSTPTGAARSAAAGIALSFGSLLLVWLLYFAYCRTRWARNLPLSAGLGLLAIAVLAWWYQSVFNGRAAILHLGVALGTIMSANVFFVIIPWHKRLLRAIRTQQPLKPVYACHPGFLSRHNHYLSLPVLMLMLAIHAPQLTTGSLAWLSATGLVASTALFKHVHSLMQRQRRWWPYLVAGLLVLLTSALLPNQRAPASDFDCLSVPDAAAVSVIVRQRCASCHAPAQAGSDQSENGLISLQTAADLRAVAKRVQQRVVVEKNMPPANATGMLEVERQQLACWLYH